MTRRLLVGYLAITVIVLLILELPLAVFYSQRERERFTTAVERDASVLATIYEDSLEKDQPPDAGAAEQYATRTGARVVVVDNDGIARVDTAESVPRDFSTRPEIIIALSGSRAVGTRSSATLHADLLYVAIPVGRRFAIRPSTSTSGGSPPGVRGGVPVAGVVSASPASSVPRRLRRDLVMREVPSNCSGRDRPGRRRTWSAHPGHAAAELGRPTIDVAMEPTGSPSFAAARRAVVGVLWRRRPRRRDASIAASHSPAPSQCTSTAVTPGVTSSSFTVATRAAISLRACSTSLSGCQRTRKPCSR